MPTEMFLRLCNDKGHFREPFHKRKYFYLNIILKWSIILLCGIFFIGSLKWKFVVLSINCTIIIVLVVYLPGDVASYNLYKTKSKLINFQAKLQHMYNSPRILPRPEAKQKAISLAETTE